jgi:enoyl-CoA hydratase/carnithine racemase
MTTLQDCLLIERKGNVDWVTLNRPERLNALDDELTNRLRDYFEGLAEDQICRVVVLRGAGRAFCAGLDLKSEQARAFRDDGLRAALSVQRNLRNIMLAMRRCPQPIVALMHGAAAGGGFALALASDIRLAADTTIMNGAFIRIGLGGCDVGSSYLLPRLIGAAPAAEILFTGCDVDAARAVRLGLISEIVSEEGLADAAETYVSRMLATSPMGLALTKECLNMNIDAPSFEAALALEDRNQVLLGQTADFREGVAAFCEKRPPTFLGC